LLKAFTRAQDRVMAPLYAELDETEARIAEFAPQPEDGDGDGERVGVLVPCLLEEVLGGQERGAGVQQGRWIPHRW
jgi:hypothetical protein